MYRALLVTLLLVTSGCLGVVANTDSTGQTTVETVNESKIERLVHEEVNEQRAKYGKDKLAHNPDLRPVARYHSEDMAETGYVAHTAPDGESVDDRYKRFNVDCANGEYKSGENIAKTFADTDVQMPSGVENYGYNESKIANGVVAGWMASPGHKENILEPAWDSQAIGVEYNESSKAVYVTQNFC